MFSTSDIGAQKPIHVKFHSKHVLRWTVLKCWMWWHFVECTASARVVNDALFITNICTMFGVPSGSQWSHAFQLSFLRKHFSVLEGNMAVDDLEFAIFLSSNNQGLFLSTLPALLLLTPSIPVDMPRPISPDFFLLHCLWFKLNTIGITDFWAGKFHLIVY